MRVVSHFVSHWLTADSKGRGVSCKGWPCIRLATPEDEERVKMEALAQGALRWKAKLAGDSNLRPA